MKNRLEMTEMTNIDNTIERTCEQYEVLKTMRKTRKLIFIKNRLLYFLRQTIKKECQWAYYLVLTYKFQSLSHKT